MKANAQHIKGFKKHHLELMMKRYLRPFAGDDSGHVGESMKEFARYEVELSSKGGHEQTRAFLFITNCEKTESINSRK